MRYIEMTAEPDLASVPRPLELMLDSPHVTEGRLLEWNTGGESVTLLYVVVGDRERASAELGDSPVVAERTTRAIGDREFVLLVRLDRMATPMVRRAFTAMTQEGLLVLKPVVYRDGEIRVRLVGEEATLQAAVEQAPPGMDLTVHRLTDFEGDPRTGVWGLTARQREVVGTALELGYYEEPREVRDADVAAELDCATSTVSEHLRKAHARLVRTAFGQRGG